MSMETKKESKSIQEHNDQEIHGLSDIKTDTKWGPMKRFIQSYMQSEKQYRARELFQAYINEYGNPGGYEESIMRNDFEMFLRDQVIRSNGFLKRTAHGIYEVRTDPDDRGVVFPRRKNMSGLGVIDDILLLSQQTVEGGLEEILDDCLDLASKIKSALGQLNHQQGLSSFERDELDQLRSSLMKSMDITITGVTAVIAWCEDYMDKEVQVIESGEDTEHHACEMDTNEAVDNSFTQTF